MNGTSIELGGRKYALLFNGYAMFAERDMFGEAGMLELIQANTAEGFEALCKAVALLAEQGELVRRYEGHEPDELLTLERIRVLATPLDVPALRMAVINAMVKGYGREVEDEEKDLGLTELEQKKTKA